MTGHTSGRCAAQDALRLVRGLIPHADASTQRRGEAMVAIDAALASPCCADQEQVSGMLEKVARAHHATITPSKLHHPKEVRFDRCQAKTCQLARAALALLSNEETK